MIQDKWIRRLCSVYAAFILSAFLIIWRNYYFDILEFRYDLYWGSAVTFLTVILALLLWKRLAESRGEGAASAVSELSGKDRAVYVCLLAFWGFSFLATVTSHYQYEAFWGNEGRFSGLFLMTLYVAVTLVIATQGRPGRWLLDLFLFAGLLISLWGITDYFRMDIFGFKALAGDVEEVDAFTSSIGNINSYTALLGMLVAAAAMAFAEERAIWRKTVYYVILFVYFVAIIMGNSDNAYLSLGILFAASPLFLFREIRGIGNYLLMIAALLGAGALITWIDGHYAVIGTNSLFNLVTDSAGERAFSLLLFILGLGWLACAQRHPAAEAAYRERAEKWILLIWELVIGFAFAAVLFVLYDANLGGHADKYDRIARYIVFNDAWGTNRGFCWRIGWESYQHLPLVHKIFGHGPDTFGLLTWDYRQQTIDTYNYYFESAHNEYLQYFVTIGPMGLISYLAFLVLSLRRMAGRAVTSTRAAALSKSAEEKLPTSRAAKRIPGDRAEAGEMKDEESRRTLILACFMGVLCYLTQAVVNINLPIVTPVMWMLLAVGLAASRADQRR